MMLVLNATLYLVALTLSLWLVTPVPEGASRRTRIARCALAFGGGAAMSATITLAALGLFVASAVVAGIATMIVGVCLWVALSRSSDHDGDDDGDDGGGGRRHKPIPPAPPEPLSGPSVDWDDFDAARAGWSRDRDPVGA